MSSPVWLSHDGTWMGSRWPGGLVARCWAAPLTIHVTGISSRLRAAPPSGETQAHICGWGAMLGLGVFPARALSSKNLILQLCWYKGKYNPRWIHWNRFIFSSDFKIN